MYNLQLGIPGWDSLVAVAAGVVAAEGVVVVFDPPTTPPAVNLQDLKLSHWPPQCSQVIRGVLSFFPLVSLASKRLSGRQVRLD